MTSNNLVVIPSVSQKYVKILLLVTLTNNNVFTGDKHNNMLFLFEKEVVQKYQSRDFISLYFNSPCVYLCNIHILIVILIALATNYIAENVDWCQIPDTKLQSKISDHLRYTIFMLKKFSGIILLLI